MEVMEVKNTKFQFAISKFMSGEKKEQNTETLVVNTNNYLIKFKVNTHLSPYKTIFLTFVR